MRRAWWLAGLAVLMAAGIGFAAVRQFGAGANPIPIPIQRSDVVELFAQPWPEGVPLDFATDPRRNSSGRYEVWPIGSVETAISVPLPPVPDPYACRGVGWTLTITLRSGREITYGPCTPAASIVALHARMVAAAASQ